jgi:hypothetical protein
MSVLKRFSRAVLIAIIISGSAPARAQPSSASASEPSAASRLPPNYRQLLAQYVRARNTYIIHDAKITRPYPKWGGIMNPGTYTAVCVVIFRHNPFGIIVRDNWILTIDQGRIKQLAIGLDRCEDLGPFPELKRR